MSSMRVVSLLGASIFRNQTTKLHPIRFTKLYPSPTLRLHLSTCSFVALVTDTTTTTANPHHPWPEWVAFVDRLKSKGYLPHSKSQDEDDTQNEIISTDKDKLLYTDINNLKDACLSFARDRFDIFKSLSRQDIQTVVEKGCPNLFRKSVNSGKRLRAYVQLDEGDVCSGCILRGSCDRAYVMLKESEAAARTVDIVRILLLYALDPLVISGGEKPPGRELIEESTRNLLTELLKLSEMPPDPQLPQPATKASHHKEKTLSFKDVEMKRGDWMCPKCNFMNFARNTQCRECEADGPKDVGGDNAEVQKGDWVCYECSFMNFSRNVRCLKCKSEGPKRVTVGVEMKKGDWNCTQCGFMNFASNSKCLRCRDQRPKRQLNPGEWECPSCDFLNYRKNMACKKCDCERPKEAVGTEYEEQIWKKPF